jgi:hypothetical protein
MEANPITADLTFREGPRMQPPRNGVCPESNSRRDRELGQPLTLGSHDSQVALISGRPASAPTGLFPVHPLDLRSLAAGCRRSFPRGLSLQPLDIAFDGFGEVAHQVEPIDHVHGVRGAVIAAIGEEGRPIPRDDLCPWVSFEPGGQALSSPDGEQIDDCVFRTIVSSDSGGS